MTTQVTGDNKQTQQSETEHQHTMIDPILKISDEDPKLSNRKKTRDNNETIILNKKEKEQHLQPTKMDIEITANYPTEEHQQI